MVDCLFCRIVQKELPSAIVYEDEDVVAFRDIHPTYRVHLLVIPKEHVASAAELTPEHDALAGKLLRIGSDLAKKEGVAESGFRLLTNVGAHAGQVVHHLHLHLLGGEPLRPL